MVPIGIWLVLLGYTVAYVGIVNVGLQGTANADGSVTWSGQPQTVWTALTGSNPGAAAPSPTGITGAPTPSVIGHVGTFSRPSGSVTTSPTAPTAAPYLSLPAGGPPLSGAGSLLGGFWSDVVRGGESIAKDAGSLLKRLGL